MGIRRSLCVLEPFIRSQQFCVTRSQFNMFGRANSYSSLWRSVLEKNHQKRFVEIQARLLQERLEKLEEFYSSSNRDEDDSSDDRIDLNLTLSLEDCLDLSSEDNKFEDISDSNTGNTPENSSDSSSENISEDRPASSSDDSSEDNSDSEDSLEEQIISMGRLNCNSEDESEDNRYDC